MLLILFAAALLAPPAPIVGRASVIDGDTIEIRGQRIRLWGIDAPEGRQTCTRAGATYRCGQEAANALADGIGQSTVTCVPRGRPDRYRRIVARCSVSSAGMTGDIAHWLVLSGHALDYPRYSEGAYAESEQFAREGRAGLWAGEFQRPWEWRRSSP